MREILFRGKNKLNGDWVYGDLRNYEKTGAKAIFSHELLFRVEIDPKTVGQDTGLKDKNGNSIFDGDICRNIKTKEILSVAWHGTMAGFVWSKRKEESYLFDFGALFRAFDKCEIIGNIHDNPELLEKERKDA